MEHRPQPAYKIHQGLSMAKDDVHTLNERQNHMKSIYLKAKGKAQAARGTLASNTTLLPLLDGHIPLYLQISVAGSAS